MNFPLKKRYKGVVITCFFDGNFCRTGFFSADNIERQALKKRTLSSQQRPLSHCQKIPVFSLAGATMWEPIHLDCFLLMLLLNPSNILSLFHP
jgi:hypothetical protein